MPDLAPSRNPKVRYVPVDMFDVQGPAQPSLFDAPTGVSGVSARVEDKRLVGLEKQRDVLKLRGLNTADVDDQIVKRRERQRDTWIRNPAYEAYTGRPIPIDERRAQTVKLRMSIEDWRRANMHKSDLYNMRQDRAGEPSQPSNPRLPPGSSPAYSPPEFGRNKGFYAGGVFHPIRRNMRRQGVYDPGIERARRSRWRQARSSGLVDPGAHGTAREIVGRQLEHSRRLEEAAASGIEERTSGGRSFEGRFGIAKPPDTVTRDWKRQWKAAGSDVTPKARLSEQDVLRVWQAYKRQEPDALPTDDWWNSVHADTYQEAMHGTLGVALPTKRAIRSEQEREAKVIADRAAKLQKLLDPYAAKRESLEAKLDAAEARMNSLDPSGDAWERQSAAVDRLQAELNGIGRKQRATNPSGGITWLLAGVVAVVFGIGWSEGAR